MGSSINEGGSSMGSTSPNILIEFQSISETDQVVTEKESSGLTQFTSEENEIQNSFPTEDVVSMPEEEAEELIQPSPRKRKKSAQDLLETKIVGYLNNKSQNNKKKSSMKLFLDSIAIDAESLSMQSQRKFKLDILNILHKYQDQENL